MLAEVHEHLDHRLTLATLAQRSGYSPFHFRRSFLTSSASRQPGTGHPLGSLRNRAAVRPTLDTARPTPSSARAPGS